MVKRKKNVQHSEGKQPTWLKVIQVIYQPQFIMPILVLCPFSSLSSNGSVQYVENECHHCIWQSE